MRTIVLAIGLIQILSSQANADELTLKRFFSEAPQAWRESDQFFGKNVFELTIEDRVMANGRTASETKARRKVFQLGHCVKEIGEWLGESKLDEKNKFWLIVNEDYHATLGRKDDRFVIGSVESRKVSEVTSGEFVAYQNARPGFCFLQFCVFDCIVGTTGFHNDPKAKAFIAVDANPITDSDGNEAVVLSLAPAITDGGGKFVEQEKPAELINGKISLTLIPARNWCVSKYEKKIEASINGRRKIYEDQVLVDYRDESCHPAGKIETIKFDGKERIVDFRCTELVLADARAVDFRLTSFGLPEPDHLLSESGGRIYWICGALIIVAASVWVLRRTTFA